MKIFLLGKELEIWQEEFIINLVVVKIMDSKIKYNELLYLAKDVLILDEKNFSELLLETEIISKMLSNFIKKL